MIKTSEQIRKAFLDYFQSKNHQVIKSSPLIPVNDNTLIFVNAGMVQFKNTFLGKEVVGNIIDADGKIIAKEGSKLTEKEIEQV